MNCRGADLTGPALLEGSIGRATPSRNCFQGMERPKGHGQGCLTFSTRLALQQPLSAIVLWMDG